MTTIAHVFTKLELSVLVQDHFTYLEIRKFVEARHRQAFEPIHYTAF